MSIFDGLIKHCYESKFHVETTKTHFFNNWDQCIFWQIQTPTDSFKSYFVSQLFPKVEATAFIDCFESINLTTIFVKSSISTAFYTSSANLQFPQKFNYSNMLKQPRVHNLDTMTLKMVVFWWF